MQLAVTEKWLLFQAFTSPGPPCPLLSSALCHESRLEVAYSLLCEISTLLGRLQNGCYHSINFSKDSRPSNDETLVKVLEAKT
jgi:hypothetical protein